MSGFFSWTETELFEQAKKERIVELQRELALAQADEIRCRFLEDQVSERMKVALMNSVASSEKVRNLTDQLRKLK
jgi:hypothetical protein